MTISLFDGIENIEVEFVAGEALLQAYRPVTVGKTYRIVWDGVPYDCKAFAVEQEGVTAPVLGNGKIYGYIDTGEPFIFVYMGTLICVSIADFEKGETATHTVGIYELTETTEPSIGNSYVEYMAQYSKVPYFEYMAKYVKS